MGPPGIEYQFYVYVKVLLDYCIHCKHCVNYLGDHCTILKHQCVYDSS